MALIAACLTSAGVHVVLALPHGHAPGAVHQHVDGHSHVHLNAAGGAHLHDLLVVQAAFVAAAAGLPVVGAALAVSRSAWPPRVAAALFLGLIGAYVLTRAVAIPGLDGTPEPVDTLGVATKLVELVGILAAVWLVAGPREARFRALAVQVG
jgi:hypothetical protein